MRKGSKTREITETFLLFPKIDKTTWFYKNCKKQRRNEALICQVCPFRAGIEQQEEKI